MSNVVVKFDPWARMGNRMFQYAFGYILAKQKGAKLLSHGLPNFNIPNTFFDGFTPANKFINTSSFGKNQVNWDELVNFDGDVIVDSYVQKASYYTPHKAILREVFKIDDKIVNEDAFVVHIRETDYADIGVFLGYEFYKELIFRLTPHDKVIIVTDNSKCDAVQKLLTNGCVLCTEGYVDTFTHASNERSMIDWYTLLYSPHIAISQSSFSWWAAFLGDHIDVCFPFKHEGRMWPVDPKGDDIDLFYDTPEAYKFIL